MNTDADLSTYPFVVAVEVLRNFQKSDANIANSFYQQYLLPMLGDVFYVLTDADHKSGEYMLYCSPCP
jgi:exportin-1